MNGPEREDEVKAAVEARYRPGAVLKRIGGLKRIAALLTGDPVPPAVREVLGQLFNEKHFMVSQSILTAQDRLAADVAAFDDAKWNALVRLLIPQVERAAMETLRILPRRPYLWFAGRKPFHNVRSPADLNRVRICWLLNVTEMIGDYDGDIDWVAAHASHLASWSGGAELGWLLAGGIDVGGAAGQRVRDVLIASAEGTHPTGRMGRHVTQALLSAADPAGWTFVEKLLLAAQREEGLRQVILETVDESNPDAFVRMLALIVEHDLARFSSVVRAVDVWLGLMWDGTSAMQVDAIIRRVHALLTDEAARNAALDGQDASDVYLALWCCAYADVELAVAAAAELSKSTVADIRFAATIILISCGWTSALPHLVTLAGDAELSIAVRAASVFQHLKAPEAHAERLFGHLEHLMTRTDKRTFTLKAILWPWTATKAERAVIARAIANQDHGIEAKRLLPYVPDLDATARAEFIRTAAGIADRWVLGRKPVERRTLSPEVRLVVIDLLGDASQSVRDAAFSALADTPLQSDEVDRLVALLDRKVGDLRTRGLKRLAALADAPLLAAADRLIADGSEPRRRAGLELLRDAAEKGRMRTEVAERLARIAESGDALSVESRAHVDAVLRGTEVPATQADAFGLLDPARRRTWPAPRDRRITLETKAAAATLRSLAELVYEHRATEVRGADGQSMLLVQSAHAIAPRGDRGAPGVVTGEPHLADVWRRWSRERPAHLRDADGFELLRILRAPANAPLWSDGLVAKVSQLGEYGIGATFLRAIIEWGLVWDPPPGLHDFLLDGLESAMATITAEHIKDLANVSPQDPHRYFGGSQRLDEVRAWKRRVTWWHDLFPGLRTRDQLARWYALLRSHGTRVRADHTDVSLVDVIDAHAAGLIDGAEFIDVLVGPDAKADGRSVLRDATSRKQSAALAAHPALRDAVDRVRARIVEVECARGDRATAASASALQLRTSGGLDTVMRAVAALGTSHFARTFAWGDNATSRQHVLSHLVVHSIPGESDTPAAFAAAAQRAKLKTARLVELALYAPQWVKHVAHALDWPGLEDAVWWIEAHTKDDRSWQLNEFKELWKAAVSERTPLAAADLTEGAVDVAWFVRAHGTLGAERWAALDAAAKYAASAGGHKRAQLFAEAMAGRAERTELEARIAKSRHQDSVRALGLLPLADDADLLARYQLLERFKREARKFGSQRQASEGRAAAIGMANLARTAGYADPQRLQWAMERAAVADLARGPVLLEKGDATLTLSVDEDGVPTLTVARAGKPLKAVPAALKKDAEVAELQARLQELKRQRARVREALETAMIRGDSFEGPELRSLLAHPILAPSLARLVLLGDGIAGYAVEGGRALRAHDGTLSPVGDTESLRIAHPDDLLARGDWSAWQRDCLSAERVQPFKQVFRELYPRTAQELGTTHSARYAGHQVQPRQAVALLGGRGWVVRPEEGVSRTFHEAGLVAWLGFQETFFTPAEVEGLTLERVEFTRKGSHEALSIETVPPRLFSEVMRDLDLVVSVAHRGGVDPEASASTMEMRATLVRETAALLGLANVELLERHVRIRGSLAEYAVHLGSAVVTVMPGRVIPIVAVHSQHRGRLFLPFADDDPRSAELMSKVLMLARDERIKDPNILDWIRAT